MDPSGMIKYHTTTRGFGFHLEFRIALPKPVDPGSYFTDGYSKPMS
jgi:hypothetical protein